MLLEHRIIEQLNKANGRSGESAYPLNATEGANGEYKPFAVKLSGKRTGLLGKSGKCAFVKR
jgi:hypothetical protein